WNHLRVGCRKLKEGCKAKRWINFFNCKAYECFFLHRLHPLWHSPPSDKASHRRKSHVRSAPSAAMPSTIRGVASEAALSSSPSSPASRHQPQY
ncbi:hypothetical protein VIGAN_04036900, partial [Vigna angularis var. angularis]